MTPVCHGSVAFVDLAVPICRDCEHASSCVNEARSRIEEMPDTPETRSARLRLQSLPVVVSRRGIARRALSRDEEARLSKLSARAQPTARRIAQSGWFDLARAKLGQGIVIGGSGNTRLEQALRALLRGVRTRQELVLEFAVSGLKRQSAEVEATTLLSVLEFGQLIRQERGQIQLSAN